MRHCTEIQRLRGFAFEVAPNPTAQVLHHHERFPPLEGDLFDSAVEIQTTRWEHLWIDVGGEG